ncbi:uroporphyrinogen decarboxylase family protein [Verrucomicrobiota bacterium]
MTSRERVEAALKHTEPDRTPVFEYVLLSPLADLFLGRRYAADPGNWENAMRELGWERAVRQVSRDRLDLALRLGHDMIYAPRCPARPAPIDTPPPTPASTPDDPVERLAARNRRSADSPAPSSDNFLLYRLLREEMAGRGVDLPILAGAYAHGVWTDVDLMQTMLLAPEVAREHFSLATEGVLANVEQYAKAGVDHIGVGGDFAGTRLIISPEAYAEFIVPEVRTVSRRVHELGKISVNASDGNLWPVIEDFLFGCEVDGYLEIDMHAGMDLAELKKRHGERVTFYGNLDCGNVLSFGTPEAVRAHTISCIEAGFGRGGHILCASNAITASVPLENYMAVVGAYRDMFGLPELDITSGR